MEIEHKCITCKMIQDCAIHDKVLELEARASIVLAVDSCDYYVPGGL